ncbi:STAS domain-containing protein [Streptomyces poriticola]|uniref:STAS domain-containing protein n=1 Tax=Streptomyces poriticola TaxID=3120506 RepID=UPI002FCE1A1D
MAEAHPPEYGHRTVRIAEAGGEHAVLVLSGDLRGAPALRELEERLLDQRLGRARSWVLETAALDHLDLACGYALLRAATGGPQPVTLTVRGARRGVHRTLHQAGVDKVAVFEG